MNGQHEIETGVKLINNNAKLINYNVKLMMRNQLQCEINDAKSMKCEINDRKKLIIGFGVHHLG